jgi:hypothetical protein
VIIGLFALLAILAAGAAAGILLTIRHYEHVRAEQQADEDELAELRELYAAWAVIRSRRLGGKGPGG